MELLSFAMEHNGLYRSCGSIEIGKVSVSEYADTRKSTLVMEYRVVGVVRFREGEFDA